MTDSGFTRNDWLRLLFGIAWLIIFILWSRLVFSITLLGVGGVFIAYNARAFWLEVVLKEHAPSVLPIFGGIIAGIGIAILPVVGSWKWAWIPLLLDWGGLGMLYSAWLERRTKQRQE